MTSVIPNLALPRKTRFPSAPWRRTASGWQPARCRSGSFCASGASGQAGRVSGSFCIFGVGARGISFSLSLPIGRDKLKLMPRGESRVRFAYSAQAGRWRESRVRFAHSAQTGRRGRSRVRFAQSAHRRGKCSGFASLHFATAGAGRVLSLHFATAGSARVSGSFRTFRAGGQMATVPGSFCIFRADGQVAGVSGSFCIFRTGRRAGRASGRSPIGLSAPTRDNSRSGDGFRIQLFEESQMLLNDALGSAAWFSRRRLLRF